MTTLDRTFQRRFTTQQYFRIIQAARADVVSFTQKDWQLPASWDPNYLPPSPPPGYDFMIYLRHHGFPSPLLDWSTSPYVAAFFAFRQAPNNIENVAIYSYRHRTMFKRPRKPDLANINIVRIEPHVVGHPRHYSQLSQYTLCIRRIENQQDDSFFYAKHEDVTDSLAEGLHHFTKYIIPSSERQKVMNKLALIDITAFYLFGTEDSFMETLAYELECGVRDV